MKTPLSPIESLALLVEGNQRFASGLRSIETTISVQKMRELATNGQTPFAIVLTCSDSRVPTEMLFDRGLGDIFVIRIAGNVVSPMVIASVEYAASALGCQLCVVMGHSECGAVSTAVKAEYDRKGKVEKSFSPDLSTLISAIRPAVREARKIVGMNAQHENCLSEAILTNVQRSVRLLNEKSRVISGRVASGQLVTIGAIYDLHSGLVTFDESAMNELRGVRRANASAASARARDTRTMLSRASSVVAKKRLSV